MHDNILTAEENEDGLSGTGNEETVCGALETQGGGGGTELTGTELVTITAGHGCGPITGGWTNALSGTYCRCTGAVVPQGYCGCARQNYQSITIPPGGSIALLAQQQAQYGKSGLAQQAGLSGGGYPIGWSHQQSHQIPHQSPLPELKTEIKPGEITAYRVWRIVDDKLFSVAVEFEWENGVMESYIDDHTQGIHCWKTMDGAKSYASNYNFLPVAIGTIEIWGTVLEHDDGYRAEFAVIKSVDEVKNSHLWKHQRNKTLRNLQNRYCYG